MSPGDLLAGRYELRREIGRGGVGRVWLAFDVSLEREVAVKTVDLTTAQDPAVRERFRREAVATAALSHPNIVTVFDVGFDGSTAFLVMELLHGATAHELVVTRGALPVDEVLDIGEQALLGTAAAHRIGVIHRDLKPANLFVRDGSTKILDFGIAQLAHADAGTLTAVDSVIGTAAYLAPEQARGERATERTDLYSLGCVLFSLIAGRPPFESEHPVGLLHQHIGAPVPRLREVRPDVPARVDALVARLMAKDPADRPDSADAARAELLAARADDGAAPAGGGAGSVGGSPTRPLPAVVAGSAAGGAGVTGAAVAGAAPARPAAATAAAPAGLDPIAVPPSTPPPLEPPRRRSGGWVAAALAVAALLVALVIWQPWSAPPADPAGDVTTAPEAQTDPAQEPTGTEPTGTEPTEEPTAAPEETTAPPEETTAPPEETTAPPATPDPTEPAPSTPGEAPPEDAAWTAAAEDLRAAVAAAPYADRAEQTRGEVGRAVDSIVRRLEQDKPDMALLEVDALSARLGELEGEGRLDPAGRAAIDAALGALATAAGLR